MLILPHELDISHLICGIFAFFHDFFLRRLSVFFEILLAGTFLIGGHFLHRFYPVSLIVFSITLSV